MVVIVEDDNVITSYPDLGYPHQGPNYGKHLAGKFKGKP